MEFISISKQELVVTQKMARTLSFCRASMKTAIEAISCKFTSVFEGVFNESIHSRIYMGTGTIVLYGSGQNELKDA